MRIDFQSEDADVARKNFTPPGYFNEMDFRESYSHIFTLKRRIRKFLNCGEINERGLLNDSIIITNNFKLEFLNEFITERFTPDELSVMKSLLLFLGIFDEEKLSGPTNPTVDDVLSDLRFRFSLPKAYHRP